ncbi:MAG TPA: hypothetical protein VN373_03835 [Methanosarcina barkeri]|nr:hypothetical protein [Methanosarcina barkeri]
MTCPTAGTADTDAFLRSIHWLHTVFPHNWQVYNLTGSPQIAHSPFTSKYLPPIFGLISSQGSSEKIDLRLKKIRKGREE